jgi:hypothetical protein
MANSTFSRRHKSIILILLHPGALATAIHAKIAEMAHDTRVILMIIMQDVCINACGGLLFVTRLFRRAATKYSAMNTKDIIDYEDVLQRSLNNPWKNYLTENRTRIWQVAVLKDIVRKLYMSTNAAAVEPMVDAMVIIQVSTKTPMAPRACHAEREPLHARDRETVIIRPARKLVEL